MITDHRRALWGSTVTLFFFVHLVGKHMPARRRSPRRSPRNGSMSPRRNRRSSGRTRRAAARRRSPKRRTYKGVDTRLHGMVSENSFPERKYGMIAATTLSRMHSSGGGSTESDGRATPPPLKVSNEDVHNMLYIAGHTPLTFSKYYWRVLNFCRTRLQAYSDKVPWVYVNDRDQPLVAIDLIGLVTQRVSLEKYFKVDDTFLVQRFLDTYPSFDALKSEMARHLVNCPDACGLMSRKCIKVGDRCVTKDSVNEFYNNVKHLEEFGILAAHVSPNKPIRLASYIEYFDNLVAPDITPLKPMSTSKLLDNYQRFMESKRRS